MVFLARFIGIFFDDIFLLRSFFRFFRFCFSSFFSFLHYTTFLFIFYSLFSFGIGRARRRRTVQFYANALFCRHFDIVMYMSYVVWNEKCHRSCIHEYHAALKWKCGRKKKKKKKAFFLLRVCSRSNECWARAGLCTCERLWKTAKYFSLTSRSNRHASVNITYNNNVLCYFSFAINVCTGTYARLHIWRMENRKNAVL